MDLGENRYWSTGEGREIMKLHVLHRTTKQWRPTVVAALINPEDEFLVVQRNTKDRNWVFPQGEIEEYDSDPIEAGLRELYEEGCIERHMIVNIVEYLGDCLIPYAPFEERSHDTGYTEGGSYTCVGYRLKDGFDVSLVPPEGHEVAWLDHRWCEHDEAVELLRAQPNVSFVTETNRQKCERLWIPAMDTFFQMERERELLSKI